MMSQQQRLIKLPLIGTILLCLLVAVYLAATKRFSKPEPPDKIIKHSVETSPDDVMKYWTADKMRNAKPMKLPSTNDLSRGKQKPLHSPEESRPSDA